MNAKDLYYQGLYSEATRADFDMNSIAYKIGSLVFIGEHTDARFLYSQYEDQMSLDALIVSRFHLGISYTRTSDYKLAKFYFSENISLARTQNLEAITNFFSYQGLAFYRYFFSQHYKSHRLALKAYESLLKSEQELPLLLALVMDLLGHNLVQIGKVHQGLKFFKKALTLTKNHKLLNLNSEIEISYYTYISEHDDQVGQQIKNLKRLLKQSKNKNDHSRPELILQIAKLYMLSGLFLESHQFLNNHFDLIYQNQNKRKVAILNTLLAQLMIYKGQFIEAISVINAAQNFLDESIDKSLLLPLLGLKHQASQLLGQKDQNLETKIQTINQSVDRFINRKIQKRIEQSSFAQKLGEDKLGDLFDKVHKKTPDALTEILRTQCLSLIYKLFKLKPGFKYIVICHNPKTTITVSHNAILDTKLSLTKIQIQILSLLSQQKQSKEDLIKKIWTYEYNSLRHDSLVYTNIARLRKALGDNGKWIYSDEQHYYLDDSIKLISQNKQDLKPPSKEQSPSAKITLPQLNYRQLQLISAPPLEPVRTSEYAKRWKITRMTAVRDLRQLCNKNLARKHGVGKATCYFIHSV